MRKKIIFDSNFLLNKKCNSFFAKLEELSNFARYWDIIIPDIVIWELEEKYKRLFLTEKEKFIKTLLHSLLNHNIDTINVEEKIQDLKDSNPISYQTITIIDYSILENIKSLALKKEAPFEEWEWTDKGFKDAYIYFAILEYLQSNTNEEIFVCTNDWRLTQALERHPEIKIIKDFNEFQESTLLITDYLIEKIKEEVSNNELEESDVISTRENINWNYIIEIWNLPTYLIEVEKGDIIDWTTDDDLYIEDWNLYDRYNLIEFFKETSSFGETHHWVSILHPIIKYLSFWEMKEILEAVISNYQINRIIHDEDVKQFIWDIFNFIKDRLSNELKEWIENLLN